jgi:hypothetical protein
MQRALIPFILCQVCKLNHTVVFELQKIGSISVPKNVACATVGVAPEKQHWSREPSARPDQILFSMSSRAGHLFLIHPLTSAVRVPVTTVQASTAIATAHE